MEEDCIGTHGPQHTVVEEERGGGREPQYSWNDCFQEKNIEINVMFLEHTVTVACL
jgi:hypothetical protein